MAPLYDLDDVVSLITSGDDDLRESPHGNTPGYWPTFKPDLDADCDEPERVIRLELEADDNDDEHERTREQFIITVRRADEDGL